jgi:hypothetical protein
MLAVAALCGALAPGSAGAEVDKGRIGVGADASLSGLAGLSGRYMAAERFGVQAILAADLYSPDQGDGETTILVGLGAIYDVVAAGEVVVGARAGVDVAYFDGPEPAQMIADSGTQVSLSFGLRPELFVTSSLSLHAQVGVVVDLLPESGRVVAAGDATEAAANEGNAISLAVDLLGSAGFTFWL